MITLAETASYVTEKLLQGIYKRVIGEDQPENGEFDQRLWISTKGDFLSSFKADRASLEETLFWVCLD